MKDLAITLRRAAIQDAEALAVFGAETFRLGCPPNTAEEDLAAFVADQLTPERFREHLCNGKATTFLAEAADGIAGYLMLMAGSGHELVHARSPIEVYKVYVGPRYQGAGIADALMREALTIIDSGGYDSAWLSVYSENARAIAFYKRWGFAVAGTQHFMVGRDPQKDFIMQRSCKQVP